MRLRPLTMTVVLGLAACTGPEPAAPSEDEATNAQRHEALVRRVLELIDARELDAAFELYAPDYAYHGPGGQELRGKQEIRALWETFFTAFPDLDTDIDDVIAAGDKVALRWRVRGTHTGEFLGIPASGQPIDVPVIEIFHIVDGRLAEGWDAYDRLGLLEQIGAVPTPER